jgi:hypothetical protein
MKAQGSWSHCALSHRRAGGWDSHRRSVRQAPWKLAILTLRMSILQRRALQEVVLVHVIHNSAGIAYAPMNRRTTRPHVANGALFFSTLGPRP